MRTSTHYAYDPAGHLAEITLPDGRRVRFGYDIVGNLTALASLAGITHRFRFDAIDQPTGYDTPPVAPTGEFPLDTRPSRKSLQSGYSPLS